MEINILYTIIIYPITQIIEFIFVFALKLFKETGIAIVCVSGAISILCLPLYMVAERWQETERNIQKNLAPKIARIKAVFKGDERYMILSTYYRQNHYHPIYALRSSFGIFIQVPFFIAAYSYLSNSEAIKNVSFLFINDLGAPDSLFSFGSFTLNLLPVAMTLINCVAGAVYAKGLALKEKLQIYGLAGIFLLLLYNSPSALVLFWTMNNVFSLVKNIYLKIPLKKKHFILLGIVTASAFVLSYYTLFIHHGNIKSRYLIAALSIVVGIVPWIIPFILHPLKKIKIVSWSSSENRSLFIFSLFILWVTTGILIPSMLIGSSPQEFSFIDTIASPLLFIFNTSVQAFGLCIFLPLLIYFLFSEKTQKTFALFAVIISLSALCNLFVFPGKYGTISSDLIFTRMISHNTKEILWNIGFLLFLSIILLVIYIYRLKIMLSFLTIIMLTAVSAFSIRNLFIINKEFTLLSCYYKPEKFTDETISPIIHLSKSGRNVFVIMLDMAQSAFIPYIFEENPELIKQFDGFIYYPNTVTFNGYTVGGAPPIFGGYDYTPEAINRRSDITLKEKNNESLLLMPRLFSQENYSVIITDPPYADNNWIPDLRIYGNDSDITSYITDGVFTDLWLKRNGFVLPSQSDVIKRNVLWYAIFREIPLAFRQTFYYNGTWCAPFSEHKMRNFLNGYSVLDFLDELTGFKPQNENSVILMTNNTAHEGLLLQAPEYKPQLTVTHYGNGRFSKEVLYHINASAINRLSGYFDFLKQHDVYDNSRIILVSDHGCLDSTFVTKTNLPFHVDQYNPLLMVKDFDAKGEMKTDMAFMTNADVPAIAMEGLINNPVNPYTGNKIDSMEKHNPQLILISRVRKKNDSEININLQNTYYVHDNIFNEKNWTKPEKLP